MDKTVTYEQLKEKRVIVPITDLVEWEDNYKDITQEDFEQLKEDVKAEPFKPSIVTPRDDGKLITLGGNQRLKAKQAIGKTHEWVSIVTFQEEDGKWFSYVNGTRDLEFKSKKDGMIHYALKDNEERGRANEMKLQELAFNSTLELSDYKVATLEPVQLKSLVEEVSPTKEVVEDEAPEVSQEELISKLGEVYQLGRHRLMCGDSTKIEDVEKLMNGQKADMVFTDPPYGVNYQSNMRTESQKFDVLKNDDEIITDWVAPALQYSTGWFLFCSTWKVFGFWQLVGEVIGNLTNVIIWDKGGGGIGDLDHSLSTDYEMILAYNRGNKVIGKRLGSVWSIGKDGSTNYMHPTQKPVELSAQAIQTLSTGSVLDLFGGSGSTLIACEQLNRTCYMMELDPKYVDVIRKRYAKFMGKEDEWQKVTPSVSQ